MKKQVYLIVAGLFLLIVQVNAQAPSALNYQGVARNSSGAVIAHQLLGLEFTVYQGSSSGTMVYQETDTATTNQFGLFTVQIGMGVVKNGSFNGIGWGANSEYLDVAMDPTGGTSYTDVGTQQLLSVPYALYAAQSGGVASSPWTTAGNNIYNNNSGVVGIGTTTPYNGSELMVKTSHTYGGAFSTDTVGNGYALEGFAATTDGKGLGGIFEGGYIGSENLAGGATVSQIYYGSYDQAYSTAASYAYGTFGYAQSTGGVNYGVTGEGVDKGAGTSYGVYGTATSSTGVAYGLYGVGAPVGCYAYASGTGVADANLGPVYGTLDVVAGLDGEVTGSSGSNTTDFNVGVIGIATNTDASYNMGAFNYGEGSSVNVYGSYSTAQTDGSQDYTIGVFGEDNANGGTSVIEDDAGYFNGDVDIVGSISKTSGTFKIDDPLDPANKYLYHSFVESPDMMNVYNGNVTTDATGTSVVTLPAYFQAENKDFKYQLTVIGQFAQAIIATKVNNNQFTIKTDKPNVEVSWQVTGVRNDPYANAHRVVAEVDKKGIEKGHYLFPQYYGQPQTMSIGYLISATNKTHSLTSLTGRVNTPAPAPQVPAVIGASGVSIAH